MAPWQFGVSAATPVALRVSAAFGVAAALGVAALLVACVAPPRSHEPSAAPFHEAGERPPRRPDGVAVPVLAALPLPAERAEARGVLSLRAPPSDAEIAGLVIAFFRSWQHQSLDGLTALLTPDAGPLDARGRGRGALVDDWRQRLQAHAYSRLQGVDLVRPERIERWTWYDFAPPRGRGGDPERPADMVPGELFVRVPMEVTESGGDRFFGDVASMVLRREGGELRIAAYAESAAASL